MKYNVFISCKKEDYDLAVPVYDYLTKLGLKVFLACTELSKLGQSAYSDAIDDVLSRSEHMIVVASRINYIQSKWVKFEWGTFCDDLQSDYRDGNLVLLLADDVIACAKQLPSRLRHKQFFSLSEYEKIIDYVNSSARIPYGDFATQDFMATPPKTEPKEMVDSSLLNVLPQQLQFSYSDKLLGMILSADKMYYIGNISFPPTDLSWMNNYPLATFSGAVAAVAFPTVGLSLLLMYSSYLAVKDNNKKNAICKELNDATGAVFSVPNASELEMVRKEDRSACLVLRVKDNVDFLKKLINKKE